MGYNAENLNSRLLFYKVSTYKFGQIKRMQMHPENPTITNQYILKLYHNQLGVELLADMFTSIEVYSKVILQTCFELHRFQLIKKHCLV